MSVLEINYYFSSAFYEYGIYEALYKFRIRKYKLVEGGTLFLDYKEFFKRK